MFVDKTTIDESKFDLLSDISGMDENQIMKHYFGDVNVKTRNAFLYNLKQKSIDLFELNIEAHRFLIEVRQREADDLPDLVHSILLNTLAFEANENLEKTLYKDYKDKNISKHAKPFIAGQYKIFRNSHEQLLNVNHKQTEKIIKDFTAIIKALAKTKLSSQELVKRILE